MTRRIPVMNALRRFAAFGCIALLLAGRAARGQVSADAHREAGSLHTVVKRVDEIQVKQRDGRTPSLDSLLKDVAQYKVGDSRAALQTVEQVTLAASDEALRKFLAGKYAVVLAGPATADAKRFLCRQLGLIGTAVEVPALEGFLADEQFAFTARSALERVPGDESLAALRRAAEKAKGLAKAGLIQSLGVRRDQKAIPLLDAALTDQDHVVAAAALNSLCRIGGEDALWVLNEQKQLEPDRRRQMCQLILLSVADVRASGDECEMPVLARYLGRDDPHVGVRGSARLVGMQLRKRNEGAGLLIDALAGKDLVLQSAAIRALHLDPKETLLKELAARYPDLPPGIQLRVVRALADGRQAAALPIIVQATASEVPAVRKAALAALSSVGNATSVPALVDALQSDDMELVKQVEAGLARLPGPGVDVALVAGLQRSSVTGQQEIVRILAARSSKNVVPVFLALTESQDAGVRGEAIRALGLVADATAGLQVIELLDETRDREAVEAALVMIYRKADTVDPLLPALQQASGPRKASLVAVLGALGGPEACKALRAALKTRDAGTRGAALRALAAWHDATPLDDLLAEAASTQDSTIKFLALRGVANLAPMAKDRKPDDRVALLRKTIALSDHHGQITPILSALGKIPCRAAAELAAGYLNDPALRDEAALAVVEIGEALGVKAREQVGAELKQARAACDNRGHPSPAERDSLGREPGPGRQGHQSRRAGRRRCRRSAPGGHRRRSEYLLGRS